MEGFLLFVCVVLFLFLFPAGGVQWIMKQLEGHFEHRRKLRTLREMRSLLHDSEKFAGMLMLDRELAEDLHRELSDKLLAGPKAHKQRTKAD